MKLVESHLEYLVPPSDVKGRITAFQKKLDESDVAVAWIEHQTDLYYYTGSMQSGVLLVPASGQVQYYVRMSKERAAAESSLEVRPYPGSRGLFEAMGELAGAEGRIGLALDVATAASYLKLAGSLGRRQIVDVSVLIRTQRAVKSEWELQQIQRAADQATAVFKRMDEFVRSGMSELDLAAHIERELRLMGHPMSLRLRRPGLELTSLYSVAGDSALYPTNFDGPVGGPGLYPGSPSGPGRKMLVAGETLMEDIVTHHNNYHADDARPFYLGGDAPDELRRIHEFCREAMEILEAAVKPGRSCSDVFEELDAWVKKKGEPEGFMGYGENRVKFFGHGVGLELDEFPVIARRFELELQAGMVLALEPKVFIPGIGGVGLENTCVLSEEGCRSLCPASRDLVSLPFQS